MSRMPGEDADDRPWEQPGAFRLDCEPHRGGLLSALGQASLLLGVLALFCLVPSVLGLAVGVPTWVLARRDLGQMEAGLMDPRGWRKTQAGLERAKAGVVLCVTVIAGVLGGWLLYSVM
jgi:hypothetical protein